MRRITPITPAEYERHAERQRKAKQEPPSAVFDFTITVNNPTHAKEVALECVYDILAGTGHVLVDLEVSACRASSVFQGDLPAYWESDVRATSKWSGEAP